MMIQERRNGAHRILWAYGYELAPPVSRDRLEGVQAVLDRGHSAAGLTAGVWEGRFINGDHVTHILVVSDTPAQDLDVNRWLEAELVRLETAFSLTPPLEVAHRRRRAPSRHRHDPPAASGA
jgi:hypothetical protein